MTHLMRSYANISWWVNSQQHHATSCSHKRWANCGSRSNFFYPLMLAWCCFAESWRRTLRCDDEELSHPQKSSQKLPRSRLSKSHYLSSLMMFNSFKLVPNKVTYHIISKKITMLKSQVYTHCVKSPIFVQNVDFDKTTYSI